jgi:hypothetical protein
VYRKQLKNYIPLSGPATRCPCDGTEGPFRVSLGFTPKWYHDRLGIDFSECWHFDPQYRYDSLMKMRRLLHEKFPTVEHFAPHIEENGVDYQCATLDGVYGSLLIAGIYGMKGYYAADNWPSTSPDDCFSMEDLMPLTPIDLDKNPLFQDLTRQMDYIEGKWGKISGYISYQGVLNNAFRLRGQEIFIDMMEEPEFAHDLFEHITETMLNTAKRVQKRQRDSGFYINMTSNSNCVMNMISPDMYEEFILPCDRRIAGEFERFGIHTCNWNATPYIDKLSKIPDLGYIDMGIDTDMERMRRVFPEARRGVLYSPVKVQNASMEEIEADFRLIAEKLAPCDLILADMETDIPDQRIIDMLKLSDKISAELQNN